LLWLVGKELAFVEGVLDDVENDVFPLREGPDEDDAVEMALPAEVGGRRYGELWNAERLSEMGVRDWRRPENCGC